MSTRRRWNPTLIPNLRYSGLKGVSESGDRVLIIDDFLAKGSAITALADLIDNAGAHTVGAGIVIEKSYQSGAKLVRDRGIRLESLARIESMSVRDGIKFVR